jgi:hypothetical protein
MCRLTRIASGQTWGLNLEQVQCPKCAAALPMLRDPSSMEELLWGGWTCPSCGCRLDKWGRATEAKP